MNHFVLGSSGKEDSLWMALEKVYSDQVVVSNHQLENMYVVAQTIHRLMQDASYQQYHQLSNEGGSHKLWCTLNLRANLKRCCLDSLLLQEFIYTGNAKCPIFLGNFTPKTSNYCLKKKGTWLSRHIILAKLWYCVLTLAFWVERFFNVTPKTSNSRARICIKVCQISFQERSYRLRSIFPKVF